MFKLCFIKKKFRNPSSFQASKAHMCLRDETHGTHGEGSGSIVKVTFMEIYEKIAEFKEALEFLTRFQFVCFFHCFFTFMKECFSFILFDFIFCFILLLFIYLLYLVDFFLRFVEEFIGDHFSTIMCSLSFFRFYSAVSTEFRNSLKSIFSNWNLK